MQICKVGRRQIVIDGEQQEAYRGVHGRVVARSRLGEGRGRAREGQERQGRPGDKLLSVRECKQSAAVRASELSQPTLNQRLTMRGPESKPVIKV